MKSALSSRECVYQKVTVECPAIGNPPWCLVYEADTRNQFMIGKVPINPARAAFELSDPRVVIGRASPRFRGLVAQAVDKAVQASIKGIRIISPYGIDRTVINLSYALTGRHDKDIEEPEFLPDDLVERLLSLPNGNALKEHLGKKLRITEYVAPVGAMLYASGAQVPSGEIVVSDKPEQPGASLQERNLVRVVIGAGLMALSLLVSVYILVL